MKIHVITMHRRQYAREGVFGEIENLTYSVLRKYRIPGHAGQPLANDATEKAAWQKTIPNAPLPDSHELGFSVGFPHCSFAYSTPVTEMDWRVIAVFQ
jgi:hypothetical protein